MSLQVCKNFSTKSFFGTQQRLFAVVVFFVLCNSFVCVELKNLTERNQRINVAPPAQLQYFSFGFKSVLSDLLWIRAIQDFDYCDQVAEVRGKLNICQGKGWLYKLLNSALDLEPQFNIIGRAGPLTLSVLVNDIQGSSQLFRKALPLQGDDWVFYSRFAYHALYEENNSVLASRLFRKAAEFGGPSWYFGLSYSLFKGDFNAQTKQQIIESLTNQNEDDQFIQRMKDKFNAQERY